MPLPRSLVRSDVPFFAAIGGISAMYVLLIAALLVADGAYALANLSSADWAKIAGDPDIQDSVKLTVLSCTLTAILSVLVAAPLGYLLSRQRFPGRALLDALLDVPIVLPPLVVGLSLLILFNWGMGNWGVGAEKIAYTVAAVIIAQFTVSCAFAVRTMRAAFDAISPRTEQVALTLGCSRGQAFWMVALPESWRGLLTAWTLAWARAMGEFGPILVFAGATRGKTEVLATTVFLEISVGNLEGAVAVSLGMVTIALAVLIAVRLWDRGHRIVL